MQSQLIHLFFGGVYQNLRRWWWDNGGHMRGHSGDIGGDIWDIEGHRRGHRWKIWTFCNQYDPASGILSLVDIFFIFLMDMGIVIQYFEVFITHLNYWLFKIILEPVYHISHWLGHYYKPDKIWMAGLSYTSCMSLVDHNYYLREAVHIPISDQYEYFF